MVKLFLVLKKIMKSFNFRPGSFDREELENEYLDHLFHRFRASNIKLARFAIFLLISDSIVGLPLAQTALSLACAVGVHVGYPEGSLQRG